MKFQDYDRLFATHMPPAAKFVMIALLTRRNEKTGACFPGIARLGAMTGFGQTTVKSAIRQLVENGLLTKTRGVGRHGLRTTNRYQLHLANAGESFVWQQPQLTDDLQRTLSKDREVLAAIRRMGRSLQAAAAGDGLHDGL